MSIFRNNQLFILAGLFVVIDGDFTNSALTQSMA